MGSVADTVSVRECVSVACSVAVGDVVCVAVNDAETESVAS